jgi:hypothetical protein
MGGSKKVVIEPHRHDGVFISRGKEDALLTRNMVLGDSVYGEKRISVEDEGTAGKLEYRVWNPFRSKLAAAILGGVDKIHMPPGSKVLYLGAASGTTVSHTVTRRSAEFRHPARMTQDSSCYIGENDCIIWAGNLHPQVPKFSVITGNFRRFLL